MWLLEKFELHMWFTLYFCWTEWFYLFFKIILNICIWVPISFVCALDSRKLQVALLGKKMLHHFLLKGLYKKKRFHVILAKCLRGEATPVFLQLEFHLLLL